MYNLDNSNVLHSYLLMMKM